MNDRKPTLREILSAFVFIGFIGIFFILNFAVPAPEVLVSERRAPARFPDFSFDSVWSGTFMSRFEDYAADRFVFRDVFRGIHSFVVFDVYRQTDKSGLYRCRDVGLGEFRATDATAFRQTTERIIRAAQSLDGLDMNIYYSIVPDKSIFAERYMPGFDLGVAEAILFDMMGDYEYISLIDELSADSFYKTDLHWDQAEIEGVTAHILSSMGAGMDMSESGGAFDGGEFRLAGEFRGVYAGQLALPVDADRMWYYDVAGLRVSYLNERTLEFESGPVNDTGRFTGVDPYDLFLRGPQPLIVIENDAAPERGLYLFRDSFGSSLAPLMAGAYSRITVIDLRYINLSIIDQFIEYVPGSDVLFIYSSQIFNNPSVLQS